MVESARNFAISATVVRTVSAGAAGGRNTFRLALEGVTQRSTENRSPRLHRPLADDLRGRRAELTRRGDLELHWRFGFALQDAIGIEPEFLSAAQANVFAVDRFHQKPQPGGGVHGLPEQVLRCPAHATHHRLLRSAGRV